MSDGANLSGAELILNLVTTGVSKLVGLIPMWIAAPAELRAKIESRARELVIGLDAEFDGADAKDDDATKAVRDAIEDAKQG